MSACKQPHCVICGAGARVWVNKVRDRWEALCDNHRHDLRMRLGRALPYQRVSLLSQCQCSGRKAAPADRNAPQRIYAAGEGLVLGKEIVDAVRASMLAYTLPFQRKTESAAVRRLCAGMLLTYTELTHPQMAKLLSKSAESIRYMRTVFYPQFVSSLDLQRDVRQARDLLEARAGESLRPPAFGLLDAVTAAMRAEYARAVHGEDVVALMRLLESKSMQMERAA